MHILIDKGIYSKEVLLKTAYSFTDKAYLHLSQSDNSWIIDWTDKEGFTITALDFENELISQQLREELLQKTADIRKLVLARAFASTIIDECEENEPEGPSSASVDDSVDDKQILKGWFDNDNRV